MKQRCNSEWAPTNPGDIPKTHQVRPILSSAVTPSGASIGKQAATHRAVEIVLGGDVLDRQNARVSTHEEFAELRAGLRRFREVLVNDYERVAHLRGGGALGVIAVLHRASTYRARTQFNVPTSMALISETLERVMRHGRKLYFALPMGGGKAPNPLKTGDNFLPDTTEWVALTMLCAFAEAVSRFYAPGAAIVTIPDAPLHTGDLAFPEPEGLLHRRQLRRDMKALGIDRHVHVVETTHHLPAEWPLEVQRRTRDARDRMAVDAQFAANVAEQVHALVFGVNLRSASWTFEHAVLVNAALSGACGLPEEALLDADNVKRQLERVGPHYVGVNHSLRTLDIPGRVVRALSGEPDYVRLSVHAKPGEPRPLLTQNSSRARPGLLPMHSVGLRFNSTAKSRLANIFEVEARVHQYRPVIETSSERFLFYEEKEPPATH